jgi:hypothetical protein
MSADLPYPRLNEDDHRLLCDTLVEIRRRFPDMRFGQLVAFMADISDSPSPTTCEIEDNELLRSASAFLDRHRDRVPQSAGETDAA